MEYEDGDKEYRWKRGNEWGLGGLPSAEVPLYGSERLAVAKPENDVVIVEGEKAADALQALLRTIGWGDAVVLGTTTGAGAVSRARADTGPTQATPKAHATKVLEPLRGRRVFLWADNDFIGAAHMNAMAQRLVQVGAAPLKWVTWPAAPPKGDAADLAASQPTQEAVLALFKDAVEWTPDLVPRLTPAAAPSTADFPSGGGDVGATRTNASPRQQDANATGEAVTLVFKTARQRATEKPPAVDWIIGGLAAAGAVTELDGPQKCGKTTCLAHAVRAKLDGKPFLGLPTRSGPAVWLTEESWATLQEPLREAGLLDRDDLYILCREDAFGVAWAAVADQARQHCLAVGANLLIGDTLSSLAGLKGDEENASGSAMEAVRPVQEIAAHGVAVIVTRHDRRAGGEVGESGRGSTAFAGAVDLIFKFTRLGGDGRATLRRLEYIGRIRGVPADRIIELTEAGYQFVGTDADVKRQEACALLLEHLPESEAEAVSLPSLWAPADPVKDRPAGPLAGKDIGKSTYKEAADALLKAGKLAKRAISANRHVWWCIGGTRGGTGYALKPGMAGAPARTVGGTLAAAQAGGQGMAGTRGGTGHALKPAESGTVAVSMAGGPSPLRDGHTGRAAPGAGQPAMPDNGWSQAGAPAMHDDSWSNAGAPAMHDDSWSQEAFAALAISDQQPAGPDAGAAL